MLAVFSLVSYATNTCCFNLKHLRIYLVFEQCHARMRPKIVVVVIPKRKDGRARSRLSLFWYVTYYRIVPRIHLRFYVVKSVSYQKKDWWGPARQSLFWYVNDKDLQARVSVTF